MPQTLRPTRSLLAPLAALSAAAGAALLLAAGAPAAAGAAEPLPPPERPEELDLPPLAEFEVARPQRVVLDNGMVVLLLEDRELPLVQAIALVETGARLEPAETVGLAAVTGAVLRTGGTERMSPDELDDFLEGRAATLESSIGETQGRVTLSALAEHFPEMLGVLADVLRRPAFAQERIEVALNQERAAVARQNDNPQTILFRKLREQVYGPDSPYARRPTFATLAAIERSALVAWHERYLRPDGVILGLVGDFETERALARVREVFGDWGAPEGAGPEAPAEAEAEAGTAPEAAADSGAEAPYRRAPSPGVFVAEKADVSQSNIALGHLGVLRSHPDFYALEVMNEILGGGFGSRLTAELRTRRGLAYVAWGQVGSGWDRPGLAQLFTTTKVETTGEAIRVMLEEARGLVERPPSDEEVARAKRKILSSFVFRIDSPRGVLQQQLDFEYYGYPLDWLSTYRGRIEAVTADEVRRAAARHLKPGDFSIVVVGPGEGRDVDLATFGPVEELDLSIPPPPAPPGV